MNCIELYCTPNWCFKCSVQAILFGSSTLTLVAVHWQSLPRDLIQDKPQCNVALNTAILLPKINTCQESHKKQFVDEPLSGFYIEHCYGKTMQEYVIFCMGIFQTLQLIKVYHVWKMDVASESMYLLALCCDYIRSRHMVGWMNDSRQISSCEDALKNQFKILFLAF